MTKTGYSLRIIVHWIDRALVAVYAFKLRRTLGDAGLPCALDVKEFYDCHFERADHDSATCPAIAALAKRTEMDPALLREIFQRVSADPHVLFVATLWYAGYLTREQPTPVSCPSVRAEAGKRAA